MNKKKRITIRSFLLSAVIGSILIMAMVIANSIWSSNQTLLETEEAVSAVSEAGETVEAAAAEVQQDFQQATQQTYEDQEFMRAVQQVAQQDMHKAEPALAYMSRDANVDKYGNVYTEEMLRNQIG